MLTEARENDLCCVLAVIDYSFVFECLGLERQGHYGEGRGQ